MVTLTLFAFLVSHFGAGISGTFDTQRTKGPAGVVTGPNDPDSTYDFWACLELKFVTPGSHSP